MRHLLKKLVRFSLFVLWLHFPFLLEAAYTDLPAQSFTSLCESFLRALDTPDNLTSRGIEINTSARGALTGDARRRILKGIDHIMDSFDVPVNTHFDTLHLRSDIESLKFLLQSGVIVGIENIRNTLDAIKEIIPRVTPLHPSVFDKEPTRWDKFIYKFSIPGRETLGVGILVTVVGLIGVAAKPESSKLLGVLVPTFLLAHYLVSKATFAGRLKVDAALQKKQTDLTIARIQSVDHIKKFEKFLPKVEDFLKGNIKGPLFYQVDSGADSFDLLLFYNEDLQPELQFHVRNRRDPN